MATIIIYPIAHQVSLNLHVTISVVTNLMMMAIRATSEVARLVNNFLIPNASIVDKLVISLAIALSHVLSNATKTQNATIVESLAISLVIALSSACVITVENLGTNHVSVGSQEEICGKVTAEVVEVMEIVAIVEVVEVMAIVEVVEVMEIVAIVEVMEIVAIVAVVAIVEVVEVMEIVAIVAVVAIAEVVEVMEIVVIEVTVAIV